MDTDDPKTENTAKPPRLGVFGLLGDIVVHGRWVVIAVWIALAVALPLSLPTLAEQARAHPVTLLPDTAPSVVASAQMSKEFGESSSDNFLVVVLTNERGLSSADEDTYRKLVDALRQDRPDVVSLQDFIAAPALRGVMTSHDQKAWLLPIGLAEQSGTPQAVEAYKRIAATVKRTVAGSTLKAYLTGPVATDADLSNVGDRDLRIVELATAIMVIAILLVVYRNPVTMLMPVISIVLSLVVSQGVVSALCNMGLAIGAQTVLFMTGIMVGAGTDYAVFLIGRYHELRRSGVESDDAVRRALTSTGKVLAASAATVSLAFLAMRFTRLGLFSSVGPALAVVVAVAFVGALTLLPALLVIAGRRGWIEPRAVSPSQFWRQSGVAIVRQPLRYLTASALLLALLAGAAGFAHYSYDDRETLPATAPSSVGYAALERHFPVNSIAPVYVVVHAPHDLRTPRALADLEQMARRISQLPDIATVAGVTRPTGVPLEEAGVTYQAGGVGSQLGDTASVIGQRGADLNELSRGAAGLADNLNEARGEVALGISKVRGVLATLSSLQSSLGGGKALRDLDNADRLLAEMRSLGNTIGVNIGALSKNSDWVGPVLAALNDNPVCDADPNCVAGRAELQRLSAGTFDKIVALGRELANTQAGQSLSATTAALRKGIDSASKAMHSIGLDNPAALQARLSALQRGADTLASGSRQVADGVQLLVDQIKALGGGLLEASDYLMTMKRQSTTPAMTGFYIPPEVFTIEQFKRAAEFFVSPDGRSVRFLVQTKLDPFGTKSMDQVNVIARTAREAQPNTTLANAEVSLVGFPVMLRDTRDYYNHDLSFIIAVTIIVVLLVLIVLLRAIVAPLYLVGSVVVSYLAALGIGVIVFQFLLNAQLDWSMPGLTFVVLVAVGADYNMLLISRIREESARGLRTGVIRTVASAGGVITAAGLIFATTMFSLLFGSISTMMQAGFVIGVGLLLDTFVVRTITVPAIAVLAGKANWWPSSVGTARH